MQVLDRSTRVRSALSGARGLRGVIASALVSAAFVIGNVVPASAATTDPLGGAGDTMFVTLQGYLTSVLIPAVLGLAVIGIAVGLLIKYVKKARAAA
jgi:hypothetical protein